MTKRSDIDRVLETWFRDGPMTMPDRVIDVVADRIARQPQRRSWLAGRTTMSKQIQLVAALAAAIVIAVVGYNFLPGSDTGGPGPTPTPTLAPTPTPTPSADPSSSARFPSWFTAGDRNGAGILRGGVQATRAFTPGFTFSVPEGWVNGYDEVGFYSLFPDTTANQAEFARSGDTAQSIFMGPHGSPWFVCESLEDNRGATAAEMVAAAAANEVLEVSGLVDVAIGGLTGKQFDVRPNPAWTETCPGDQSGLDLGDARTRAVLLDAPGRGVIVIFVGSIHAADFDAFLAEAMPIVESFEFDLQQ